MNWIPRNLRFSPEYRSKRKEEDNFKRELSREHHNRLMGMLGDIHREIKPTPPPAEDGTGEQSLKWKYLAVYNVCV